MHSIICPRCHTQMTVPDNFAGRLIPCAYCSTPITVPPAETDALAHMAGAAAAAPRYRRRPARSRGLWAAALAAVALVVAIALFVVLQSKLNSPNDDQSATTPGRQPAENEPAAPGATNTQSALAKARLKAGSRIGSRIVDVRLTAGLDDDSQLAGQLAGEARQAEGDEPLVAAILYARAGLLLAPVDGKYDAALAEIHAAIALVRSTNGSVEREVYEIGEALRELAKSPEARQRRLDTGRDPSFFGVR